ncbi:phage baseplate assembly protein V [Microbacterium telephonicum]|uniref:Gp5/Type VI secretion system Vgr protein OB-fold domain-containing protein n=1 Tax=Microbacterium telephonicum TaxID=1714841 RepID=A0A498BX16_9MICO|nr:phage baseplate assembly protein V [Microbacterium telephonicum]RLK47892.1 hypothetical protein C7474_2491 [Microbacterium telephonicum]
MGVHRARIVETVDPQGRGRVQIALPSTDALLWAPTVVPFAAFTAAVTEIGADVWVAFEADDPDRPVVLGLVEPPPRTPARARDREALGDAWDRGHAAGSADAAADGDTTNPYR